MEALQREAVIKGMWAQHSKVFLILEANPKDTDFTPGASYTPVWVWGWLNW